MKKILDLADSGNIRQAAIEAQRNGQNIDPRVLQNGQARYAMRTAIDVSKAMGASHDQAWISKFTQAFMQNNDINAGLKAAGQPTQDPKANKNRFRMTNGDVIDTATGNVQKGVGTPGGPGSRGPSAQIQWLDRVTQIMGGDQKKALAFIAQAKSNPASERTAIANLAKTILSNDYGVKKRALAANRSPADQAIAEATTAIRTIQVPGASGADDSASDYMIDGQDDATGAGDNRQTMQLENGSNVYTVDGGQTWYNSDDDTPYTGGYEGE